MGLKEFGYAFAFLILTAMFGGMLYFAFTYLGGGAAGIAFFALPLGVCCFGAFIFFLCCAHCVDYELYPQQPSETTYQGVKII